jgi:hypothetical protein
MSNSDRALMAAMKDASGENSPGFGFLPDPEQLDLLRDDKGRLPADALRQMRVRRGPGRPAGARNVRNEKIAKWFIAQYGDPLAALGEVMNMPFDQIYETMVLVQGGEAKNKRVTGRDAMEFWRDSVLSVLPYIHGKQPIAIDVTGKADAVIFIPGLNAPAGLTGDQLTRAVETLGVQAIERNGIRLSDGRLIDADGDLDDDPDDDPDAGAAE